MNIFKTNKSKSFDDIKEEYLSMRRITREKGTLKGDKTHMKVLGEWLTRVGLNHEPIRKINKYHITQFSEYLARPKEEGGRYLDRGTCTKYYDTLCNLYKFLIEMEVVEERPFDKKSFYIPTQREDHSAQMIPEEKVAPLLLDMYKNDFQLYVAFMVVWGCGLRPRKELRTRKDKDFNLDMGMVRIEGAKSKVDRTDMVTIPAWLVEVLREYGVGKEENKEKYLFGWKGNFGDKPISENMFSYRFNQFRNRHGISDRIKFYSAKINGGVDFLESVNHDVLALMKHYRHTKLTTTQIYVERKLGLVNTKYQQSAVNPIKLHSRPIPLHKEEKVEEVLTNRAV